MLETPPALAVEEWLPRSGSWEEAVNPYQLPSAPDTQVDDVMAESETGSPPWEGY